MKVLLVDDDAFLRDMYATKFGETGAEVDVAAHAEEALPKITPGAFDVVILDMVMPGMGGVELLETIIATHGEQAPACIVLSNQGESTDIDVAMAAGAIGYIVKAESIPSEVVSKVQEIVSNAKTS